MGYIIGLLCGIAMIVIGATAEPVHVTILMVGIVLTLAGAFLLWVEGV